MGFLMRKAQPYFISFDTRSAGFARVRLRVPQSNCEPAPATNDAALNRLSLALYLQAMPSPVPLRLIQSP